MNAIQVPSEAEILARVQAMFLDVPGEMLAELEQLCTATADRETMTGALAAVTDPASGNVAPFWAGFLFAAINWRSQHAAATGTVF
jgi:hypothetical protein